MSKPQKLDEFNREKAKELSQVMKELKSEWSVIENKIDMLNKDCDYFQLNRPVIDYSERVKKEIAEEEQGWKVL